MNYAFRIKFYLNQVGAISSNNREEHFLISNDKSAKIYCYEKMLSESSEIYIHSDGYNSEVEARLEGEKVKKSILIACSMRRIFVDVGKDRATSMLGEKVKQKIWNEHQIQIIDEVHGLDVYDARKQTSVIKGSSPSIILENSATDLIKDIQSLFSTSVRLNDKDLLAFELYGASGFEKSSRSKFLTLMLAIESMMEQKKRSPKIVRAIKDLIKSLNAMDLNGDEIESIKGSIGDLENESISKSGENLARSFLGSKKYNEVEAPKFFRYCYKIRSNLVHHGEPKIPDHEFSGLVATLEIFVHDILESKIKVLANNC